jgi:phosphoadenosine phosphosulfate reductase
MLIEKHIDGYIRDKVAIAIDRLRAFEPEEGYYLAFSGGKDSQCIYHLAVEAGVKFDAHYNLTTVDPPELVKFIKTNYSDVLIDYPKESMWKLIVKNNCPPYRNIRWCCRELKEHGGTGRICVTGVRWAESVNRKNKRKAFEVQKPKTFMLFDDNDKGRRLFETCMQKGKRVVNPIIDWEEEDVWDYLNSRKIKHCCLYDEGFHRLGCIGCPMSGDGRKKEFARWPKYKQSYLRAFEKVIKSRKAKGLKCTWDTAEEMMNWWLDEPDAIDYTDSFLKD